MESGVAVSLVENLLKKAIENRASDIHLEPYENEVRVRYRIDGTLVVTQALNAALYTQLVARLKVLGQMNVTQKRLPQDGKFVFTFQNTSVDVRISTFPSVFGEKVVIRILDYAAQPGCIDQLGFSELIKKNIITLLGRSQGFFIVTGPTGSGKTTTLYAALQFLNNAQCNIVTLEDPVEYTLIGITQAQIAPEIGFTFANGIRSLLRQDPDVIMIGEIRDKETAMTAIEAAMTGHLVLSTMHTNDAVSAVMRLMEMGIEPYLINAVLSGVLAQRLVRVICNDCIHQSPITQEQKELLAKHKLSAEAVSAGAGCNKCNQTGYYGRAGIFESLVFSQALRLKISHSPKIDELYQQAIIDGMVPLVQDALGKLQTGKISFDELVRLIW